jgi:hypothetical protein
LITDGPSYIRRYPVDTVELAIQKMLEGCQRMITVNSQGGAAEEVLGINP